MKVMTLSSKGRITIPKVIRDSLHLQAGDKVEFVLTPANEIVFRSVTTRTIDVFGILAKYKKDRPIPVEKMGFEDIRDD